MSSRLPDRVKEYFRDGKVVKWWDENPRSVEESADTYVVDNVFGNTVLDVGVGRGRLATRVVDRADNIVGIDISLNMVKLAKVALNGRVHLVVADAERLPFKSASFDCTYCVETLVHIPHPEQVMQEMHRVLRRSGIMLVQANVRGLDRISYFYRITPTKRVFISIMLRDYLWKILPYPRKRNAIWRSFTRSTLTRMVGKTGLEITVSRSFKKGKLVVMGRKTIQRQ